MHSDFACGLCYHPMSERFWQRHKGSLAGREYWRCTNCQLIQVPVAQRLDTAAEKAIYDLHQNEPNDVGYQRFLNRTAEPLAARLSAGAQGLDFGCGPQPALAAMLSAAGFPTTTYDLFYANVPHRLQQQYDFVTCTEVVEHLGQPREVFEQLVACLKPQGWLVIMTKRWLNRERFGTWFYLNDPTHISFFHLDTFHWLAEHFHLEIDYVAADVVMLRRPAK